MSEAWGPVVVAGPGEARTRAADTPRLTCIATTGGRMRAARLRTFGPSNGSARGDDLAPLNGLAQREGSWPPERTGVT